MAQGLSTPDPSLSPTHLSIRRGRATTTHYTHHHGFWKICQVSLVVSRNTTLVPSLGLRIGPACEVGLSAGMRRERVSPQIRKKENRNDVLFLSYSMPVKLDAGSLLTPPTPILSVQSWPFSVVMHGHSLTKQHCSVNCRSN